MDWGCVTTKMALAFMLGWQEQAVIEGDIAAASLNQDYSLAVGYDVALPSRPCIDVAVVCQLEE